MSSFFLSLIRCPFLLLSERQQGRRNLIARLVAPIQSCRCAYLLSTTFPVSGLDSNEMDEIGFDRINNFWLDMNCTTLLFFRNLSVSLRFRNNNYHNNWRWIDNSKDGSLSSLTDLVFHFFFSILRWTASCCCCYCCRFKAQVVVDWASVYKGSYPPSSFIGVRELNWSIDRHLRAERLVIIKQGQTNTHFFT